VKINIFKRKLAITYSDRYPEQTALQKFGFKVLTAAEILTKNRGSLVIETPCRSLRYAIVLACMLCSSKDIIRQEKPYKKNCRHYYTIAALLTTEQFNSLYHIMQYSD